MKFQAYIFPESVSGKARIQLDACNRSEPGKVYSGPHAGKLFLDAGMAERDPRWVPLFQPLIADPSNEVQVVELTADEITPDALK